MNRPKIIKLPKIEDPRGNLTFLENLNQIPFDIKRVFWTYDGPSGVSREGHAYQSQLEFIIALSGSFKVETYDGIGDSKDFSLNCPDYGLLVPPMVWRKIKDVSSNGLILHVSSSAFNETEYIRDFEVYCSYFYEK